MAKNLFSLVMLSRLASLFSMMLEPDFAFPFLVLDAASPVTVVGLRAKGKSEWRFCERKEDATRSLFAGVSKLLREARLRLSELRTIAYCEGPGSMLGVRVTVMGLRSWLAIDAVSEARIYAYDSLSMLGSLIKADSAHSNRFAVASDARRSSWNWKEFGPGADESTSLAIASTALVERYDAGPIYTPESFPGWTPTTVRMTPLAYDPTQAFAEGTAQNILRGVSIPEPLILRPSEFQRWEAISRTQP